MKTMVYAFLMLLLGCHSVPDSPSDAPWVDERVESGDGVSIDPDALRQTLLQRYLDEDGVVDYDDNCTLLPNPGQRDHDEDGVGDLCDACPSEAGTVELGCPSRVGPALRVSRDGWRAMFRGADWDQDGVPMPEDNCPLWPNPGQKDSDADGWGDVCDRCSSESSPETIDGCAHGERWAVQVAIENDPEAFCVETCHEFETCHMVTSRFPGATGERVRSRCIEACREDASLRNRVIEQGRSNKVLPDAPSGPVRIPPVRAIERRGDQSL